MKFSLFTKTLMVSGMLLSFASAHATAAAEISSKGTSLTLGLTTNSEEAPAAQLYKILVANGVQEVQDEDGYPVTTVSSGSLRIMHSQPNGQYSMTLRLQVPQSSVDVTSGLITEDGKTRLTQSITLKGAVAKELDRVLGKNQLQGPGNTLNAFRCFDPSTGFECQFGQILN